MDINQQILNYNEVNYSNEDLWNIFSTVLCKHIEEATKANL